MDTDLFNKIKQIQNDGGDLRHIRKKIGDEKLKEFIADIYPANTITELESLLSVPDSSIGYWFKQLNIPFIRHHAHNISFPGNSNGKKTVSDGKIASIHSTVQVTPELSYLIGFTLGDGSVQKYMVEVFNQDRSLREYLLPILKRYGTVTEDERTNGLWRLRLSSVKIANLIKENKIIREDTLDYILSNDELAQRFIAAFWDAEGTVRKQENSYYLYLYNTNKKLLDRIGGYLKSVDITYTVHSRFDKDRTYFHNGRKVTSTKPMHRFYVPKIGHKKWFEKIGVHLKHSKKSAVAREMISIYGGGNQYE